MKKITSNYSRWKLGLGLFLIMFAAQVLVVLPKASALPALNVTFVRLDRLAKSTATKGVVCAEPSVAGDTEGKVLLTFPAGFTVGASWSTDTTATTGWPSGAIAWPTIQATGSGSGQVVTFTSGDLSSASQVYCFNWTNTSALTTPATTGQYAITVDTQTGAGAGLETATATTDILDTNCGSGSTPCDQIAVTASVTQSFTFTLSSNTAALGNLSTASPSAATAINASVSTNAKSGWQVWAADPSGTPGLRSATSAHTIAYSPAAGAAVGTLSNGAEGYNLGAATPTGGCTGTTAADAKFASGGVSFKGGGLDNTLRTLATSNSTANACAVPLTVNASISNTTPSATDYAGTMTVVGAGLF